MRFAWYATTATIKSARTPVSAGRLPRIKGFDGDAEADTTDSGLWTAGAGFLGVTAVTLDSRSSLIAHIMSHDVPSGTSVIPAGPVPEGSTSISIEMTR